MKIADEEEMKSKGAVENAGPDDPQLASVPILAMTANAFQEDVEAAIEAGMKAHIAKPVDVDVLMRELVKVLK